MSSNTSEVKEHPSTRSRKSFWIGILLFSLGVAYLVENAILGSFSQAFAGFLPLANVSLSYLVPPALLLLTGFLLVAFGLMRSRYTTYAVDDEWVKVKKGALSSTPLSAVPKTGIRKVEVHRTRRQKILGTSDVNVRYGDNKDEVMALKDAPSWKKIDRKLDDKKKSKKDTASN